eukprot:CAMPEP_0114426884 /NCGR_PEP_ID=MMETSP0103-20121206/8044_1 /TAXON_ID=37642 ORGANISM="Paraphysomonas imperforata, Strain PA2" /NCGR_SAMPLE_ID=MMETSP0103 /ASSEMBLY_ACC=CAM_ASM_000201 /LENGTH=807 /DNA_ID=CAMNT_0001595891 /DNA_START=24 /DNA_END=2447 /DNA_ORIENTATION=-
MREFTLSTPKLIYLIGALSCVGLVPLLFEKDDPDDKDGSIFLHAVQSNQFENMLLISLALAIPAILDLLADLVEKRSSTRMFDDDQFSRFILAVSMLSQPLLLLYYAVQQENLIATYAVKNFRAIACATVVVEQLHTRCEEVFIFGTSVLMLLLWNFGSVIGSYSVDKDPSNNIFSFLATLTKGLGGFMLVVSLLRHYFITIQGKMKKVRSDEGNERWHTVALEVLIVTTLIVNSVFDLMFTVDNLYNFSLTYLLGTSYLATFFQFLYSNTLSQQFRFDLVVAKEKLSIKRQFVRYVSHEVRTPLNSCTLGLTFLKKLCEKQKGLSLPAQVSEDLENVDAVTSLVPTSTANTFADLNTMVSVIDEISDCCDTAVDFMNNMLFYEKIDSLDLALYFKPEDLRKICEKSYDAFLLSARHLSIDLTFEIHETISAQSFNTTPLVRADYAKINVVLRNLISNALKFSSSGGCVKMRVVPIDMNRKKTSVLAVHELDSEPSLSKEATTHYRVIVQDEGIGLSKEEQRDLFRSVIQFNPNDSQSGGGSGLGLFLSHKIIKDHGASIGVFSEGIRGRGTKFFVDFPKHMAPINRGSSFIEDGEGSVRLDETNDDVPIGMSSRAPFKLLTKPLHELNILIVDDSVISRKMFQRSLEQLQVGSSFDQAGDGVELLNMVTAGESSGEILASIVRSSSGTKMLGSSRTSGGSDSDRSVIQHTSENSKKYKIHPGASSPPPLVDKYDVIVVDKSMPLMDGDVATAKLREWGYGGIIFGLTGNALAEDLESFCSMGADYAFSKPIDIEEFIKVANEYYIS